MLLNNILSLLVFKVRGFSTKFPDAPMFFTHFSGGDMYQIIVQKVPHQETRAA